MQRTTDLQRQHSLVSPSDGRNLDSKEDQPASCQQAIHFRRYSVLPSARRVLVDGRPIEVGGRAFDVLMTLIEARGAVVSKRELITRVWPGLVVEEINLRVQISAIRRLLGKDRGILKTVPGRGYLFAEDVTTAKPLFDARGLAPAPERISSTSKAMPQLKPTGSRTTGSGEGVEPAVVVIDDDKDVREGLQSLLRAVGLRAELFASPKDFLARASTIYPQCFVLDVRLPGRSGLDFHDDLVKSNVRRPVVFISGHADVPMSVRAMKAGAVEFLTKPIRPQDLLDAVQLAISHA